jgi:anthranilate phosphoribosyltransferase
MTISHYIKDIGRGKEGARHLAEADAYALMRAMLSGQVSDLELGAALMALRIKGEAPAELRGFLRAVHECTLSFDSPAKKAVVIPSYNGARKLPNLVPLLAVLLAREGLAVLVHGVKTDATRTTTAQIFRALGLPVVHDASGAMSAFGLHEPAFMAIDDMSPALARLLAVRNVVGVRNSAHTLVKLLCPLAPPAVQLVSYTHPEYHASLSELLTGSQVRALLMRGTEGEAVADARRSQTMEWFAGGAAPRTVVAAQAGVLAELPVLPHSVDAASTANWIQSVLAGEHPVPAPIARQVQAVVQCARGAATTAPTATNPHDVIEVAYA